MFRVMLRRFLTQKLCLIIMLSLFGGLVVVTAPPVTARTQSSSAQFGVQHADAKPKKKKKKKGPKNPAKSRPKPNVAVPCSSLRTQTILNIPASAGGTVAQREVYLRSVLCAINAVPGSKVRDPRRANSISIPMYSIDDKRIVDALIFANKRNVRVLVTLWKERVRVGVRNEVHAVRLANTLGGNPNAFSYVIKCVGSCLMSGTAGNHHVKLVAIPLALGRVGKRVVVVRNITYAGSANLTRGNTWGSWNDTQLVVNDACLYRGIRRYADATRLDRYVLPFAPVRSCNGVVEVHFSPGKKSDDPIKQLLARVKCKYKEGGRKKRSVLRFSVYKWTLGRKDLMELVIGLRKKGCSVALVTSTTKREDDALVPGKARVLRSYVGTKLNYAGIPVYDSSRDTNRDGKIDIGTHMKGLSFYGALKGSNRTQFIAIMGGMNWTSDGRLENTEAVVLVRSRAVALQLMANWNRQARLAVRLPCWPTAMKWAVSLSKRQLKKLPSAQRARAKLLRAQHKKLVGQKRCFQTIHPTLM